MDGTVSIRVLMKPIVTNVLILPQEIAAIGLSFMRVRG
jgi:hypothetical protein